VLKQLDIPGIILFSAGIPPCPTERYPGYPVLARFRPAVLGSKRMKLGEIDKQLKRFDKVGRHSRKPKISVSSKYDGLKVKDWRGGSMTRAISMERTIFRTVRWVPQVALQGPIPRIQPIVELFGHLEQSRLRGRVSHSQFIEAMAWRAQIAVACRIFRDAVIRRDSYLLRSGDSSSRFNRFATPSSNKVGRIQGAWFGPRLRL
jgi:hypothetical protein